MTRYSVCRLPDGTIGAVHRRQPHLCALIGRLNRPQRRRWLVLAWCTSIGEATELLEELRRGCDREDRMRKADLFACRPLDSLGIVNVREQLDGLVNPPPRFDLSQGYPWQWPDDYSVNNTAVRRLEANALRRP